MHSRASLVLGLMIMACSGGAVFIATDWPWKAALFPIVIGVPVFCLATAEVLWVLLGDTRRHEVMDFQISTDLPQKVQVRRTLEAMGWMLGFLAAIALLSFPVAVPLLVFLYLKLRGGEGWGYSLVFATAVWGFFHVVFDRLLHLPFPTGWIQGWLGF
ncbi:MAG TPA: tripartite tricarboxylate transporter TctB family protein [Burkholderiales bacterium]|nr:tripartite tricarboxylate transporter TctB family protein [Burkholderiales bacterium]